jgi:nicotinate-nucleotide adenylyltransferase
MARIGIIGGSFNPIHIAHLIIADRFVEQQSLDTCLFVPTNVSPFKQRPAATDATAEQRLAMVSLATVQHPAFAVSDAEIRRGGVSYTVDTVKGLLADDPSSELFLLIGSDQAIEFVRWKDWQEIARLATICIARRPFLLTPEQEQRISESLTVDGRAPVWIVAPLLEISSTEIRERVARGVSVNYLTVKAVRDYIAEHGLYR